MNSGGSDLVGRSILEILSTSAVELLKINVLGSLEYTEVLPVQWPVD
jgi:hypothetical protein